METKKNPKKDLTRNSGLFFAAGMAMVLAFTYVALEWKTFYGDTIDKPMSMAEKIDLTEDAIVITLPPPPPPPVIDPPILKVLPNDEDQKETEVFISLPTDDPIMPVDSIQYVEPEPDLLIPITAVEVAPIFPGCENSGDKIACFNKMIKKHITKNFHYPESAIAIGSEGRVSIMFEIQKDGSIGKVSMRGPDKTLEKEAARIIAKLPQMTPGKHNGKNVRIPFSIPITFELGN
jgi:protein TonB